MKKCFLLLIAAMFLFSSCLVSKKVIFVEDMLPDTTYSMMEPPPLQIQNGDRLAIVISSQMPELAAPFNAGVGSYQVDGKGDVMTSTTPRANKGYLVDDQGMIDFPILGSIYVNGLTIDQIKNIIKHQLIKEKFISDPVVSVELVNLRINMMGEVNRVGVLEVPDGRITLLEAITHAGGLTVNAASNRIRVIRQNDGEQMVFVNDIMSRDIFESPTYYLQQNDIVYVEPRDAEITPKVQQNWRYVGTGVSLLGTVFAILNFIK